MFSINDTPMLYVYIIFLCSVFSSQTWGCSTQRDQLLTDDMLFPPTPYTGVLHHVRTLENMDIEPQIYVITRTRSSEVSLYGRPQWLEALYPLNPESLQMPALPKRERIRAKTPISHKSPINMNCSTKCSRTTEYLESLRDFRHLHIKGISTP